MPYLKKPTKNKSRRINTENRQKVYQSKEWQALRIAKLMEQPLCEMCLAKGIVTPATEVHHDISFLEEDGINFATAFDYSNLIALCKECHSKWHRQYGKTNGGMKQYIENLVLSGETASAPLEEENNR